jgi:hypothetical protein
MVAKQEALLPKQTNVHGHKTLKQTKRGRAAGARALEVNLSSPLSIFKVFWEIGDSCSFLMPDLLAMASNPHISNLGRGSLRHHPHVSKTAPHHITASLRGF